MCHAVDPVHNGANNASVVYIASCPTTPINQRYVEKQLSAALDGRPPPDQQSNTDVDETIFQGYTGYQGLDEDAKRALGFYL